MPCCKAILLHDMRADEPIKAFLQDVWEAYTKVRDRAVREALRATLIRCLGGPSDPTQPVQQCHRADTITSI